MLVTTKKQLNINNNLNNNNDNSNYDLFNYKEKVTPSGKIIFPLNTKHLNYKDEKVSYKLIDKHTSDEEILNMINNLTKSSVMAVDTETTGLCPHLNKVRLVQISIVDPVKENYIIDTWKVRNIRDLLNVILSNKNTIKIFQNVKYDYKMLKGSFGVIIKGNIFDTMVEQQIIDYTQKASLEAITFSWLNEKLDKTNQRSDWSLDELSEDQLMYSIKDVLVLHDLRNKMRQRVIDDKLVNISRIELNCIKALSEMEYNGFSINESDYLSACGKLELRLSEGLSNNNGNNEYLKYARLSSEFGMKFLSKYLNKKTRKLHLNLKQISDHYGNIKYYDFDLGNLINFQELPDFSCNNLLNCITPENPDKEVFLNIGFYVINMDNILHEIKRRTIKTYTDKTKREISIIHSLAGRKIQWNSGNKNNNSSDIIKCLYDAIKNDLTKEILYYIYEELIENNKYNGKLNGIINGRIILTCKKEESLQLKDKIKYIIYNVWNVYSKKYGIDNPIIPEINIINKLERF